MARLRLDGRDPAASRTEAPARAAHPAMLLELQRTAGNAAVSALIARKRSIPEDADELADVASAAPEMIIDTTEMTVGNLGNWVTAARGSDRTGFSVDIRIGAPMAGQPKVNRALTAMAMAFFNLRDGSKPRALVDQVKLVDIDFSSFGGDDGHFRFTSVTVTPAARGKDAQVDVIVELVHKAPADFKPFSQLDRDRRLALENRFSGFGFVKAEPGLGDKDPVETWLPEQWAQVLQALERIPDPALSAVPGVRWVRGHGNKGPTGESGYFAWDRTGTQTLTLYDGAFKGSDEGLVALIAHELGHALSAKPQTAQKGGSVASSAAWKAAVQADGGRAITDYGAKDAEEAYADAYSMFVTEPETMKVLRPRQFAFFTANPTGQAPP